MAEVPSLPIPAGSDPAPVFGHRGRVLDSDSDANPVSDANSGSERAPVRGRSSRLGGAASVACSTIALGAAAWVIYRSLAPGRELQREAPEVFLGAAPLTGRNFRDSWDWRFGWGLVAAGVIGAGLVAVTIGDGWRRWSTRRITCVLATASAAFATALAATDGADGLLFPVEEPTEYLSNLPRMPGLWQFIDTFTARINDYSVHVRGHPPGYPALLWLLDRIGLGGPWPIVTMSVLATAATTAFVFRTVHIVAGDEFARRCAPFLAVAPSAIWMMVSADAVFAALAAGGTMLLAWSLHHAGRRHLIAAAAGGFLLGLLPYFTYLGAVFGVVPAAVLIAAMVRSPRRAALAGALAIGAALLVTAGWLLAGFWWFDGVAATKREYWEGSAQFRVWSYFGAANIAAALIALGPATVVGLTRLRRGTAWLLVGAGIAALTISHLSQYTKAEVERIWLPFYPWIVVAGGALATGTTRRARARTAIWLAVQASGAIALQAALWSKW